MKVRFNKIWLEDGKYIFEYHTKRKGFIFKKPVHIRFISNFPHYVLEDIFWMLKCNGQSQAFSDSIYAASSEWSNGLDVEIGILKFRTAKEVDLSFQALKNAVKQQGILEKEWSELTGEKYPNLGMPKRSF